MLELRMITILEKLMWSIPLAFKICFQSAMDPWPWYEFFALLGRAFRYEVKDWRMILLLWHLFDRHLWYLGFIGQIKCLREKDGLSRTVKWTDPEPVEIGHASLYNLRDTSNNFSTYWDISRARPMGIINIKPSQVRSEDDRA